MTITNLRHVERQWPKPSSSGWTPDLFMSILSALAQATIRTACVRIDPYQDHGLGRGQVGLFANWNLKHGEGWRIKSIFIKGNIKQK